MRQVVVRAVLARKLRARDLPLIVGAICLGYDAVSGHGAPSHGRRRVVREMCTPAASYLTSVRCESGRAVGVEMEATSLPVPSTVPADLLSSPCDRRASPLRSGGAATRRVRGGWGSTPGRRPPATEGDSGALVRERLSALAGAGTVWPYTAAVRARSEHCRRNASAARPGRFRLHSSRRCNAILARAC